MIPLRTPIDPARLRLRPHALLSTQWMLLSAGDYETGRWNGMTIAWGLFGTMWGFPTAQVVVRPQRFTRRFLDEYSTFTLCAFPKAYHAALQVMGERSGRDGNKTVAAGLTPIASTSVAAPAFAEAELVIECRKVFQQDMLRSAMLDPRVARCYSEADYHRMYFGEMVSVQGTDLYAAD